jgi:hypothetical protein
MIASFLPASRFARSGGRRKQRRQWPIRYLPRAMKSGLSLGQNRKPISFDFPDAVSTTNYGISNDGTIAGSYLMNNVTLGFLAVPEACE